MFRKLNKKGFSLVELLVVITIIAILSVVAYTAVGGQTVKAKNSRRLQDISSLQSALELYYIKYGEYPEQLTASTTPAKTGISKEILPKMPVDPKTKGEYKYLRGDSAGGDNLGKTTYILGATLEEEDAATPKKAYIVGSDGNFSFKGSDGSCDLTPTNMESTSCFPY